MIVSRAIKQLVQRRYTSLNLVREAGNHTSRNAFKKVVEVLAYTL